jgi:D-beta-D-heptose 7-phosphate kinase / D-beta-D-heptose 1-phosphate adenosyltransferase
MTERSRVLQWVERLGNARVLVIGDVMLDRYIYGDISRISPEAPVPVLKYADMRSALGGAGNVVRNLSALGTSVTLVSVIGDDLEGEEISGLLKAMESVKAYLILEPQRSSIIKTRFVAARQQVLRLDRESTHPIRKITQEKTMKSVRAAIDNCDVVVLSDYGKGFLCSDMPFQIINYSRQKAKPVFVDPKDTNYTRYSGASLLTPNLKELAEATQLSVDGDDAVIAASNEIVRLYNVDAVLATRSKDGMSLIEASGDVIHLRAEAKEIFDVSGAGDTVIAVVAAAFGAGASLAEAANLANIAAGIVVGKVGTAVPYPRDMIQAIHHQELSSAEAKVLDIETAIDRVELWRRTGYRIGFTNGVFDLLHPGHISLLSQAAKACDRLIVGINGDISVRSIKGEDPVQHEGARSDILASLKDVDIVIIFQEDTPVRLLDALHPDILVKGSNYSPAEVVGADLVKGYGGEVILAEIANVYTTNSKIAKITNGTL